MLKTAHRSASLVPQIVAHLLTHPNFTCKFSELPASYQKQPYNLPAKLLQRGGIQARITFNKTNDTFAIVKFGIIPVPKSKTKKKTTR